MTHVWLNGQHIEPDDARFAITDHGPLLGDGLIETFLARDGEIRDLRSHLARLRRSCGRMGIALRDGDDTLTAAVEELAAASGSSTVRMRITVTSGEGPPGLRRGGANPTVLITATPAHPEDRALTAVTLPWRRNENSPITGLKTISMAENVVAMNQIHPADEGIWLNTRDQLCEGTTTNVFLDLGKGLVTPPLSSGCLPGIAREGVLARAVHWGIPIGEHSLDSDILDDVRAGRAGMFLTNAVRGVALVKSLDGHEVHHGPLTTRLKERWDSTPG